MARVVEPADTRQTADGNHESSDSEDERFINRLAEVVRQRSSRKSVTFAASGKAKKRMSSDEDESPDENENGQNGLLGSSNEGLPVRRSARILKLKVHEEKSLYVDDEESDTESRCSPSKRVQPRRAKRKPDSPPLRATFANKPGSKYQPRRRPRPNPNQQQGLKQLTSNPGPSNSKKQQQCLQQRSGPEPSQRNPPAQQPNQAPKQWQPPQQDMQLPRNRNPLPEVYVDPSTGIASYRGQPFKLPRDVRCPEPYCNLTFCSLLILDLHKNYHVKYPFVCTICCKFFKTTEVLREHTRIYHSNAYLNNNNVYESQVTAVQPPRGRFNRAFTAPPPARFPHPTRDRSSMPPPAQSEVPQPAESGASPKLHCPVCREKFTSFLRMEVHISQKHRELLVYKCQQCKAKFATKQYFRHHLKSCSKE